MNNSYDYYINGFLTKCAEHGIDEGTSQYLVKQALLDWTHHLVPWETNLEKRRVEGYRRMANAAGDTEFANKLGDRTMSYSDIKKMYGGKIKSLSDMTKGYNQIMANKDLSMEEKQRIAEIRNKGIGERVMQGAKAMHPGADFDGFGGSGRGRRYGYSRRNYGRPRYYGSSVY